MAIQYSIQKMVSDGTLSTIALGIQYLQRNDIYMRVAGEETPQSGAPSGYTWSFVDNTTLKILPVVPNGVEVVVYRRTDIDSMYNVYSQNAQFDESTIDENNQQLLYIAQEYLEQGLPGTGVDTIEYVRDDGSFTYYRMRRTDGSYSEEFTVPSASSSTKVLTSETMRRSYAESGFRVVGTFQAGFTLTAPYDVALDEASGRAYSGAAGSYPAGTPTAGFFDVSKVNGGRGGMTLSELQVSDLPIGTQLGVKGRGDAIFVIEFGTVYDGFTTLPAGPLKIARLQFNDVIKAEWCGAVSNSEGVLETETTAALNAMFQLAKTNAGAAFHLDGKYYTNGEVIVPLVTNHDVYPIGFLSIIGNNSIILQSHAGAGLRIETGASIGNRNYSLLVQDLQIIKRGTRLLGKGVVVNGAFSPTFRRVICGNHDVGFENWCSSEVLFDKCVAYQCNIGILGSQLSNPNGVDNNDYSVVTYNQFVCFGFEKYGIYSEGGGASIHLGGTIASPGLAARAAISYAGQVRSVSIDSVLIECQQLLADCAISFTGAGLKRSIYIKNVVQEVINSTSPSTLIRADSVENITIEGVPFSVQGNVSETIKYAIIDGAKKVTLNNCARTEDFLNKIELYDIDEFAVDNLVVMGKNTDLQYRLSGGAPLGLRFDGAFSATAVTDDRGKAGATCTQVMTLITRDEYNRVLANKRPVIAFAKVKVSGASITSILKTGNTSNGQITKVALKTGRWKTHFFLFPVTGLSPTTEVSCGVNFTGVSAVSRIGFLSDIPIISDKLYTSQESVTAGITGWPLYETIYNTSTAPGDTIGWVNTQAGVKAL